MRKAALLQKAGIGWCLALKNTNGVCHVGRYLLLLVIVFVATKYFSVVNALCLPYYEYSLNAVLRGPCSRDFAARFRVNSPDSVVINELIQLLTLLLSFWHS